MAKYFTRQEYTAAVMRGELKPMRKLLLEIVPDYPMKREDIIHALEDRYGFDEPLAIDVGAIGLKELVDANLLERVKRAYYRRK